MQLLKLKFYERPKRRKKLFEILTVKISEVPENKDKGIRIGHMLYFYINRLGINHY